MSWPGTTEMKNGLLNCTQCHTLERVARSKHTADEWKQVLARMGRYAQGSTPERPQLRPNEHGGGVSNPILQQSMGGREGEDPVMKDRLGSAAAYHLGGGVTVPHRSHDHRPGHGPAQHLLRTAIPIYVADPMVAPNPVPGARPSRFASGSRPSSDGRIQPCQFE